MCQIIWITLQAHSTTKPHNFIPDPRHSQGPNMTMWLLFPIFSYCMYFMYDFIIIIIIIITILICCNASSSENFFRHWPNLLSSQMTIFVIILSENGSCLTKYLTNFSSRRFASPRLLCPGQLPRSAPSLRLIFFHICWTSAKKLTFLFPKVV